MQACGPADNVYQLSANEQAAECGIESARNVGILQPIVGRRGAAISQSWIEAKQRRDDAVGYNPAAGGKILQSRVGEMRR